MQHDQVAACCRVPRGAVSPHSGLQQGSLYGCCRGDRAAVSPCPVVTHTHIPLCARSPVLAVPWRGGRTKPGSFGLVLVLE